MLLRMLKAEDNFFDLSTSTHSQKLTPNGSVTFFCTVYTNRAGISNGVQWFRRQGTLSLMIASEVFPNFDFDGNQRYTFERGSGTPTTFTYIMKISNLQLQDSATIECGNPRFTKRASLAFAVCDDPNSESCSCMVETGWASPGCFDYLIDAKEKYDGYHRAVVGLGVGLAFAILIAIALTVCFVRSCTQSIAAYQKDKENSKQTENPTSPRVMSLAPPGASVLKQPSHASFPTEAAGHSVRFSEDKSFAQNQHMTPDPSRQAVNQGARPKGSPEPLREAVNQGAGPKGRIPSISANLYPSLDAVYNPTPDGTARNRDIQKQTLPERSYVNAQGLPPQNYQPYGLQYSGQPYVPQQLAVVASNAGAAMHNHGAVFIDPGSTSI